jgi:16S rRNA U516 pseudouridylate synthase RsuA-like enzyme
VQITVIEGRKHVVRRLLEAVGHPVLRLRRTAYDGILLGRLEPGRWRALSEREIGRLREAPRPDSGGRGTVRPTSS